MQNYDNLIRPLTEQNTQIIKENRCLKDRLDIALKTIVLLLEEVQQLKNEVAVLKGQKPLPKIPPSFLEGAYSKDKQLEIHNRRPIKSESIPEGVLFKGCQKFSVQDIILRPYNTVYELKRWQLSDGTYLTGKLPQNIYGHYNPQLVAYILHQYYSCRVTEPLLFAQLKEIGVLISEGLQGYKKGPTESLKSVLEKNFGNLFSKKQTTSQALNKQLAKNYVKKCELLKVVERQETPLHNNGTETDAREMVVKQKVSGGTRSDMGRKYRDTFVSLKKTCCKLDITFFGYLEDRINKLFEISKLSEIIASQAAMRTNSS